MRIKEKINLKPRNYRGFLLSCKICILLKNVSVIFQHRDHGIAHRGAQRKSIQEKIQSKKMILNLSWDLELEIWNLGLQLKQVFALAAPPVPALS